MGHTVLGKKLGMTQVWDSEGALVPVTVVQVGPCVVAQKKDSDGKDGYDAVKIAYEPVAERKISKAERGVFETISKALVADGKEAVGPHRHVREFRVTPAQLAKYEVGQTYTTDYFRQGYFVDVAGTSKGRGFAGVLKRHGMHGADAGHGAHEAYRHPGTGGQGSATPGRVPKGRKRPGQYGNTRASVLNVMVVNVDKANNLLYIQGSLPGPIGGLVAVREAIKTPWPSDQ